LQAVLATNASFQALKFSLALKNSRQKAC